MDQLKLLNYYKMISNFAINLVGAFVALIVYQATNNIVYAAIYLVSESVIRILYTLVLKKFYNKYPQLLLLLRIIPITLYNIFIFVLNSNLIIGVIGVCMFKALDNAMNGLPREIIFNYSSLTKSNEKSSIGVTRLFEQIGVIVALILGGFLLDTNKTLVLILSLAIYAISVIPLIMFYIKSRHQKTFNKDATSNAVTTLSRNEKKKKETIKLSKKLVLTYGLVYFSFAALDMLQTGYSLYVFIKKGEFATAGILNAVFNLFYAVGFYIAGKINEKKDITKLVSVLAVIIGICAIVLPFINLDLFIVICAIYGVLGISYPFLSLFVLDRMLNKSRIMACSNASLYARELGCVVAYSVGYCALFFGPIGLFIWIAIGMTSSSVTIPIGEEKTRQNLVDFLQNNEKASRQVVLHAKYK